MNVKDALKSLCALVQSSSGLKTALAPVNAHIERPYATVSLVNQQDLTAGGISLKESSLVNEWHAQIVADINLYTNNQEIITKTQAFLKNTGSTFGKVEIINCGTFQEISTQWQSMPLQAAQST